jgi:hypothetical protein
MKLIVFKQISNAVCQRKIRASILRFFSSILLGISVGAICSPNAMADVVGVVTAVSQPTGEVTVNGTTLKLSSTTQVKLEGEKKLVDGRLENISAGQSISYREEGSVVRQITILKRPIDLPLVTPPNRLTVRQ